jgi:phage-related protein
MSDATYDEGEESDEVSDEKPDKPLVWLSGEIKTPPFSSEARVEAGVLLRRLQRGESIGMPHSRPMPDVAKRCHELRIRDQDSTWRIFYRIDSDAILILDVDKKKSQKASKLVIDRCKVRLKRYDDTTKSG